VPEKYKKPTEFIRTLYDFPRNMKATSQVEMYRKAHPAEISDLVDIVTYLQEVKITPKKQENLRINPLPTEVMAALHEEERQPQGQDQLQQMQYKEPHHAQSVGNRTLLEDDIPWLKQQWYKVFKDILQGTLSTLPPLREVNHEINLIDPDKRYTHCLPTWPVPLRMQFYEKLNCYVDAGWWKEFPMSQALLLICLPKKDGRL
jgi:hypothetical protein